MNRKRSKSRKMRLRDLAVDAGMAGEVAHGLSELRRLGVTPAPYNLISPWQERVRSVELTELLIRIRRARRPSTRAAVP